MSKRWDGRDPASDADELAPGEHLADVACGYVPEVWPPVAAPAVPARSELVELILRRRRGRRAAV